MEKQSFVIETQVPVEHMPDLMEFLNHNLHRQKDVTGLSQSIIDGNPTLSFTLQTGQTPYLIVQLIGGKPITACMIVRDEQCGKTASNIKRLLILWTRYYEERMQEATLDLIWNEGDKTQPLAAETKKPMNRSLIELHILLTIGFLGM